MSDQSSGERPTSVQRAAICLWVSAGLALILTVVQVIGLVETAEVGMTAIIGVVTAGVLALIAAKVSAGRNWARWLFAVIYVIGSFTSAVLALVAPELFRALPTILQGSTILQFLLQTAALVLIFTNASRQWFKAKTLGTAP